MQIERKLKFVLQEAGNVVGGGDWSKDRIIPDLIKRWSKSKILEIRNPFSTRPWQFVLEPIGAYLYLGSILLKKDKKINFESFNIGPRKNVNKTVIHLIKLVKKDLINLKFQINKDKTNTEAKLLKLNCNKIFKLTRWKPVYNFNQTVQNTISWYKYYYLKKGNIYEYSVDQIKKYIKTAQNQNNPWISDGKS